MYNIVYAISGQEKEWKILGVFYTIRFYIKKGKI